MRYALSVAWSPGISVLTLQPTEYVHPISSVRNAAARFLSAEPYRQPPHHRSRLDVQRESGMISETAGTSRCLPRKGILIPTGSERSCVDNSMRRVYFAKGSGRIWTFTTLSLVPLPPSMCQGVFGL